MKRLLTVAVATSIIVFSVLLLTGCNDLTFEAVGTRFFLNEDFSGLLVVTFYGLESAATTPEQQNRDFEDLIAIWSYDNNASDPQDTLVDIKLWVEEGKLIGSYVQHFKDIREVSDLDREVVIDSTGIHFKFDEDQGLETAGLITEGSDTLRTLVDIDEATGDSVLTEIEPEINHFIKVSWPPGTREFGYKMVQGEETPPQTTTAFADTFVAFLENLPPFEKRLREFRDHVSKFIVFEWLEDREALEQERQEVCSALRQTLSAPDPDPEKLQDVAWRVSDPERFGEEDCLGERLKAARMAAELNPKDFWNLGLLAEALTRSGHPDEAMVEIERALAVTAPDDSLMLGWMQELREKIPGKDGSDR